MDPAGIPEIFRTEPHHVITRDSIALCLDVDGSQPSAPRCRIHYLVEWDRLEFAPQYRDHRSRSALQQIGDRRVTQVARVFRIHRNGRCAAKLVVDGLVYQSSLDAALFEPIL